MVFALAATLASVFSWYSDDFQRAWIGNPEAIFQRGEWYRLFTSMLLHSDIRHLLSNLLFLIPFGGLLTNYFGWRIFPLAGVLIGIFAQYLSLKTYPLEANLLGASGLLYVLFGLWLALYYRAETQLKRRHRWLRIIGFGLVMLVPQQFQPEVSYRTHYIGLGLGLAAGIIYGFYWRTKPEPSRPLQS